MKLPIDLKVQLVFPSIRLIHWTRTEIQFFISGEHTSDSGHLVSFLSFPSKVPSPSISGSHLNITQPESFHPYPLPSQHHQNFILTSTGLVYTSQPLSTSRGCIFLNWDHTAAAKPHSPLLLLPLKDGQHLCLHSPRAGVDPDHMLFQRLPPGEVWCWQGHPINLQKPGSDCGG